MNGNVALDAKATHIAPIIAIRVPVRKIVMRFLRGVDPAALADGVAIQEQAIPLLP